MHILEYFVSIMVNDRAAKKASLKTRKETQKALKFLERLYKEEGFRPNKQCVFDADSGPLTRQLLTSSLKAVTNNRIYPHIGITTPAVWDNAEAILSPKEQTVNPLLVDAGFEHFCFTRGNISVPIVCDKEMSVIGLHRFIWINIDYTDNIESRYHGVIINIDPSQYLSAPKVNA